MDEYSACALQYGHLGKAIYLPDSQSWTFSRTLARRMDLSYGVMDFLLTTWPSFFGLACWNNENNYPIASLKHLFKYAGE